jgi:hypothetical protein
LQKKINIKLIYTDTNNDVIKKLKLEMEKLELSYELYPDPHSFGDSILVSVSDYIVCCSECINAVSDIVKAKFKSAKIIHLTDSKKKGFVNEGLSNIIKTT